MNTARRTGEACGLGSAPAAGWLELGIRGVCRVGARAGTVAFVVWLTGAPGLLAQGAPDVSGTLPPPTNRLQLVDLPTVLRLARAQNLDVQIARERLKEAQAQRASANERFLPWIAPGATYGRHEGRTQAVDGTMLDADKQEYGVGAGLTAWLDLGDAIYQSLAAKQLVRAADSAVESQLQDSAQVAAHEYFELARHQALAEVFEEARRISEAYQHQLHEAVEAGVAFRGDELRVQVQSERYETAVRQAHEHRRVAAARLAQRLHLDPSIDLVPRETDLVPITLIPTNAPLDALLIRALEGRPDLRQNQALIGAAREIRRGSVYAPLIPSVGAQAIVGGLGGGPIGHSTGLAPSEDFNIALGWRIGPGGLFDSGRIRASEARLETTRLSGEKLRDEILRQVVEGHARIQSLGDQLLITQKNLATSAEALRLTHARKQFGVGAVLEDLQAQQELARARSDYLGTIVEFNQAQYQLVQAVGGLTEPDVR